MEMGAMSSSGQKNRDTKASKAATVQKPLKSDCLNSPSEPIQNQGTPAKHETMWQLYNLRLQAYVKLENHSS